MPKGGRNRACESSLIFNTFMLMLHEGAQCLNDVRVLRKEFALMKLMGMNKLPSAHTSWATGFAVQARFTLPNSR